MSGDRQITGDLSKGEKTLGEGEDMGKKRKVKQQVFVETTPEMAFEALTRASELREWFSDGAWTQVEPGGRYGVHWNQGYHAEGTFTKVEAPHHAAITWQGTETEKSDLGLPDEVFVTTYTYDGLDRLISITDSSGNTTSCAPAAAACSSRPVTRSALWSPPRRTRSRPQCGSNPMSWAIRYTPGRIPGTWS